MRFALYATLVWRYEAVVIALARIVDAAVALCSLTFLDAGLARHTLDWANNRCDERVVAMIDEWDDRDIYIATIADEDTSETNVDRIHREMVEDSGCPEWAPQKDTPDA